jgi:hypothetical protein
MPVFFKKAAATPVKAPISIGKPQLNRPLVTQLRPLVKKVSTDWQLAVPLK